MSKGINNLDNLYIIFIFRDFSVLSLLPVVTFKSENLKLVVLDKSVLTDFIGFESYLSP